MKTTKEILELWNDQEKCPDFKPILDELLIEREKEAFKINNEENIIIHNAVIFMANDLLEEIQTEEAWEAENPKRPTNFKSRLPEMRRRWGVMISIVERLNPKSF